VEGVLLQLPKYPFVEESQSFMEMVTAGVEEDNVVLEVSLHDFESFIKALIPR
jgi:hypothetical protein